MIRIYFAVAITAAIFLAYITGVHVGNIKCDTRMANMNTEQIIMDMQIAENVNETSIHTGISDVRRILHEKYTIGK